MLHPADVFEEAIAIVSFRTALALTLTHVGHSIQAGLHSCFTLFACTIAA